MQTWSISYTADKNKLKNRNWQQGKLNYNVKTQQAHFYDEENVEIGRMKLKPEQVAPDSELNLWKHLVEVGVLEEEETCVEDLFEKLNKELGIEEFNNKKGAGCRGINEDANTNTKKPSVSIMRSLKPKIPTKVENNELTDLYDILYTLKEQKSEKIWQDGLLKFHPTLKLGEFYDAKGTLMHKKTMEAVEEGAVIETAAGGSVVIEISAKREQQTAKEEIAVRPMKRFNILYTTDKHKKSKKWLDGRMEYDESTKLARFIDEESGDCFYKKVQSSNNCKWSDGEEFETGMYIIQIDHEITEDAKCNKENRINASACNLPAKKKVKSVVADGSLPLLGRSNAELLSLLNNKNNQKEQ